MDTQPVLTWAAIVAALQTVIVLVTELGLTVSPGLQTAILAAVTAVGPLVGAAVARTRVTPLADPRDNQGRELRSVTATDPR